jgi:hypothetical protein
LAYVPVPKDLTKVKTKVALNLTKRQILCFSCAAVVGVPAYLLTRSVIGNSTAVILMIALMLPFFFLAMFERDGQPAEKIIRNYIRAKLWKGIRVYKTENLYNYLEQEGKLIAKSKQKKSTGKPRTPPAGKHQNRKRK